MNQFKRLKRAYLSLVFISIQLITAAKTQTVQDTINLTFDESVDMLMERSLLLKAARLEYEHMAFEREATKGLYYPHIKATAVATLLSNDIAMHVDLTGAKEAIAPIMEGLVPLLPNLGIDPELLGNISIPNELSLTIQEKQLGLVMGSLTQPIYTGGKIKAANRAAEARLHEAKEEEKAISDKQMTELISRYYALLLADEAIAIRESVMDGMEKHLHDAKKLEENGMISKVERLHAEVAFADAQKEYRIAKSDWQLVQTSLQNTLCSGKIIRPTSKLGIARNVEDVTFFQELALEHNPQLKQLESKGVLVDQLIKKEKSEYLPEVAFMASANILESKVTDLLPNWFVGVGVNINIFDGFARENKIKAAKVKREEVDVYLEKAKKDIQMVILKSYLEMDRYQEEYQALNTSLEFAHEYLHVRETSFAEGFSNSTDVVDAQLNLSKAKIDQLKASYRYQISLAQLLQWSGLSTRFSSYQQ